MTTPEQEVVADFPPETSSPAAARRFLRTSLESRRVPELPLEIAILLGSELVANAVLHARTEVLVRLTLDVDCLRVEVHDGSTRRPTTASAPDDATSGRGWTLVRQLAENWGVEPTAHGKVVWFELPLEAR